MAALLRTPATAVWGVLIFATLVSWTLGTQHGIRGHTLAGVVILLIAFIKVRLVGMYFMELRDAPILLRGCYETYCVVVCTIVTALFVFA
jgi:heme/copper-type cytochrome/quinol oxidase subunit 4